MMWIFIISDALTFAGFLIAYGFMRQISPGMAGADGSLQHGADHVHDVRPDQQQRRHGHGCGRGARGESEGCSRSFLALTIVGGAIFLGCQVYEWCALHCRRRDA